MTVLFALASALGWGSSGFAAGAATRKSSAIAVAILMHLVSLLALLFVVVRVGSGGLSIDGSPTSTDIAWGCAAGVAGGAGALLLFHGLAKGSVAVIAPITATIAASIPVLFGIVTGDAVAAFGIVGIAMALVAIVLVSLTGSDDEPAGDPSFDEPMVVPEGWSDEFRLPAPSGSPTTPSRAPAPAPLVPPAPPAAFSSAARAATRPAVEVSTLDAPAAPLAPPPIEMTHSAAPTPPAPRFGIHDGELRMSLRTVRQAVLALVATAVLSAAAIAARPIDQLLDGAEYTGSIAAQLVFALVIVGLAAFALNNVKPLFDFSDLTRRRTPSTAAPSEPSAEPSAAMSWGAILRQPGVTEALCSGVGLGLFFVLISRASEAAGQWPLVSARGVSVVMLLLIALAGSTKLLPARGSRLPVMVAGVLDAAAAVCFVLSIRAGFLSVAAVLAALYPVVAVLLGRITTKQPLRRQQLAGLGLALCAIGLLAI